MKQQITTLAVLAALTLPAGADDEKSSEKKQPPRPPITKKTPDEFPEGMQRFNGMLVGRLAKKDVEKGTFVINVDVVPRVWRNSKAEDPKSIVGKNVEVDGVFGKWLDVLLLVKEGETLECEARHDGGNKLTFPGELLRKAAPYKAEDYPILPEAFRGFNGSVAARIVRKDTEMLEMIIEVDRVIDTWKGNKAKKPESIKGKQMMLAGFWRRKDAYHGFKAGDRIEVGLQHISQRSDHLSVVEFIRKAPRSPVSPRPDASLGETRLREEPIRPPITKKTPDVLPDGMNQFMGSLVGRLVTKDVEKGTLVINVDAVPRVWNKNKASNPKSVIGKNVAIDGIPSRLLDRLLLTKEGDTLEVAGQHIDGNSLTFPGELFRKVAPYKAEDYPVLPDGFRGFQGVVTGKIVKKDPKMFSLIVKVDEIGRTWDKSRAKNAEEIVGKTIILAGFWRRKEMYAGLKVGDRIESGLQHQVTGTDVVSVAEFVRKATRSPVSPRPDASLGETRLREFPAGMREFRGVLVGRVISRDVEKGEVVVRVESVKRLGKQNKAADPDSSKGRVFTLRGFSGKILDVVLSLKPDDRLEFGAAHIRGDFLDRGEVFKKIE